MGPRMLNAGLSANILYIPILIWSASCLGITFFVFLSVGILIYLVTFKMLFTSSYPNIDSKFKLVCKVPDFANILKVPTQVTVWDYLFKPSSTVPTFSPSSPAPKGFTNTETGARITHQLIKHSSVHVSTALSKIHGLQPGDVVSICSPNSIMFPVAMFGVMRAGGIAALSSPAYGVDEMVHVLKTVNARFVICSASSLDVVQKAATELNIAPERIFVLDGHVDGFSNLGALVASGKRFGDSAQVEGFRIPTDKRNSEVCALLCFSSGTTGLPKAVSSTNSKL